MTDVISSTFRFIHDHIHPISSRRRNFWVINYKCRWKPNENTSNMYYTAYYVQHGLLSVGFLRYHRNMLACWTADDNTKWSKSSTRYGTRLVSYSIQNRIRIKRLLTRLRHSQKKKSAFFERSLFTLSTFETGYLAYFRQSEFPKCSRTHSLRNENRNVIEQTQFNDIRDEKLSSLHLWRDDLSRAYRQSKNLLCSNNVKRSNDCFILTTTRGYLYVVFIYHT